MYIPRCWRKLWSKGSGGCYCAHPCQQSIRLESVSIRSGAGTVLCRIPGYISVLLRTRGSLLLRHGSHHSRWGVMFVRICSDGGLCRSAYSRRSIRSLPGKSAHLSLFPVSYPGRTLLGYGCSIRIHRHWGRFRSVRLRCRCWNWTGSCGLSHSMLFLSVHVPWRWLRDFSSYSSCG